MNPYNPQEFAEAFGTVDATDEPEAIRNLIDEDQQKEILQSKSGKWYSVENGELKQVEG
jgi:predicted HTH transcriptional regulator